MTTSCLLPPALSFSSTTTSPSDGPSRLQPRSPGYNALPSDEHEWRAWRAQVHEIIEFLVTEPPSETSKYGQGKQGSGKSGEKKEVRASRELFRRSSKAIRDYVSRSSRQSAGRGQKEEKRRFTRIVTDPEFLRGKERREGEIYAVNWPSMTFYSLGMFF
jgi:hypothetical protein